MTPAQQARLSGYLEGYSQKVAWPVLDKLKNNPLVNVMKGIGKQVKKPLNNYLYNKVYGKGYTGPVYGLKRPKPIPAKVKQMAAAPTLQERDKFVTDSLIRGAKTTKGSVYNPPEGVSRAQQLDKIKNSIMRKSS
jgi:hypothetical protein